MEGAREEVRRAAAPPPGAAPNQPPSPPALHGALIDRPAAGWDGLCPHRCGTLAGSPSPRRRPEVAVRAGGERGQGGRGNRPVSPLRRRAAHRPGPSLHHPPVTSGSPRCLWDWTGRSGQRGPEVGPEPGSGVAGG